MPASLIVTPPELIDHIASFISSPKDLLSLALTSSHFPDILVPLHLQTCTLRCDIARRSVWSTLSKRPNAALRIRRLVLIVESDPFFSETIIPAHLPKLLDSQEWETVPLQLPTDFSAACLMDLINVLPMMKNLYHFGWRELRGYEPEHLDMLFEILSELPDVQSLDINQLRSRTSFVIDFGIVGLSLWDKSNLVHFKMSIVWIDEFIWSHIMAMLIERCPAMETLDVGVFGHYIDVKRLFSEANWPQLRTLSLIGELVFFRPMSAEQEQMITNAFWGRHPKLKSLTLMPSFRCPAGRDSLYIPPMATMSLQELALTYNGSLFFWFSPAVVRNVTYFRLQSMVLTGFMVDTCLKILRDMTALRFFSLLFWNSERFEDLVLAIQGVEVLHWIVQPRHDFDRHLLFTALPCLTHIAGILPAFPPNAMSSEALSLIHIMSRSPSLKYVSTESDEEKGEIPVWIHIQRDRKGRYAGHRSIARSEMRLAKGLRKQWMPMPP